MLTLTAVSGHRPPQRKTAFGRRGQSPRRSVMMPNRTGFDHLLLSRREMLSRSGMGFAALGLAGLMASDQRLTAAETAINPLAPRGPHFPGKAKRVIHLFMNGGPSHVDTFDPKSSLTKYAGKELPTPNLPTERKTGAAFASPYKFAKHGQSGIEVSEIFPN